MIKTIGITGVLASGKSYVSSIFSEFGALVFNCDIIARKLQISNKELKTKIIHHFGDDFYLDNNVNVEYVKSLCFSGTKESFENLKILTDLTTIYITEYLINYRDNLIDAGIDNTYILVESAILFETKLNKLCDKTICVKSTSPITAAYTRNYMTKEEWEIRMSTQLSDDQKVFDYLIGNDYTTDLKPIVEKIHNEIIL